MGSLSKEWALGQTENIGLTKESCPRIYVVW